MLERIKDFNIVSKNRLLNSDATYFSKGKITINTTIASSTNLVWASYSSVNLFAETYSFSIKLISGKTSFPFSLQLFNGGTQLTSRTVLTNNDTNVYVNEFTATAGANSLQLYSFFGSAVTFENCVFEIQLEQGSYSGWSEPNSSISQNFNLETNQVFRSEFNTDVAVYADSTAFEINEFESIAELKTEIQNDKIINYDTVFASNSDYSHSMIYGQSLGSGVNGFPTVSTSNKVSNVYRFKEGVRAWDALNLLSTTYKKAYLHRVGSKSTENKSTETLLY